MLPKKNRLERKEDFQKVIRKGSFFSFGDVALKAAKNNLGRTRTGFLVGRKSAKNATGRNRIKRMLRGTFLRNLDQIKPGLDIVIFCKFCGKENKKFECNDQKIKKLLVKNNLLRKN